MIVAGPEGLVKNAYRKFTIRGIPACRVQRTPLPALRRVRQTELPQQSAPARDGRGAGNGAGGDDYAMMREVLRRRFARALKEDPERERGAGPTSC